MQLSDTKDGAFGLRKFAQKVEKVAALIMGGVTLLTFTSAFMRYIVSSPIPDSHDFGRLALGIAIFWGVASVNFVGNHISVDLFYEMASEKIRRIMDIFASALVLICFSILTVMMSENAADVFRTGEYSYDLRLPIWPAYWLMVIGAGLATILTAYRLWLLLRDQAPEAHSSI